VVARPDGVCPEERPAGIGRSGVVAVVDPASSTPRRRSPVCPACGVHPSGFGVRDPAVRPVRCPVTWGRRPAGPAVGRLLSTRAVSSRLVSAPPSGRARLLPCLGGGVWGPGRGGRATLTTGTGGGPGGCRAVDGSIDGRGGRDAGAGGDPGRRVGCGPRRPRLPAERPGRPGRRAGRPSRPAARWARGAGCSARWRQPPRGCRPRAGCATTLRGRRRA
jgi:hypothetical protein